MSRRYLIELSILLSCAICASTAAADSDSRRRVAADAPDKEFDQIFYKGVVGNVLDGIPMDPAVRVNLQRTNAIVSNTLSGRSLAVLAGLSNPALLIGGIFWGVWAASKIEPKGDGTNAFSEPRLYDANIAPQHGLVASLDGPPDAQAAVVNRLLDAVSETPIATAESSRPPRVRSSVMKVWLPQRASSMTAVP